MKGDLNIMRRNQKTTIEKFACDFETVVFDNPKEQDYTEVWASAWCKVGCDDEMLVHCTNNIDSWYSSMRSTKADKIYCYFHNLKFDGEFIIYYLHHILKYEEATEIKKVENKDGTLSDSIRFKDNDNMVNGTYKYMISDVGQWYTITIKDNNRIIEIRDSLKLIPMSIKDMGKAFNTKHRKLEIDYVGHLRAGEVLTEEEKAYIKNDVLVLSESLQFMFSQGLTRLTIGANCICQFKYMCGKNFYESYFPDLTGIKLDKNVYGYINADEYIRSSYKGGYCWINPINQGIVIDNGASADLNSMYPSQMHSISENMYPIGTPKFYTGKPEAKLFYDKTKYVFVRFSCGFSLKPNKMPTVQVKNNLFFLANEWLTTSQVKLSDGRYSDYTTDISGNKILSRIEFTMTETDFLLFVKHYDIWDLDIKDYCVFDTFIGIFDEYVEKFMQMKIDNDDNIALRTLAKLFLNNLYGKFSSSTCSSFKMFDYNIEEYDNMETIEAYDRKAGFIAIGSAITSYSRNYIINNAMKFYPDKLCYIDTDSIHIKGASIDLENNLPIHEKNLNCFKIEGVYDKCYYFRQKFYVEREAGKEDYKLTVCGLPVNCKEEINQKLINGDLQLTDLKQGFKTSGKLIPKRIKGGIVLIPIDFEIR